MTVPSAATGKLPVSVFIIAKNEADRIPHSIRSVVDWADEVFVIDSGSTDDTLEVSRKLGATALFNTWTGYGPQKVFGESLCRNDWVLNIDADEEVSPELRAEIEALFRHGGTPPLKWYSMLCRQVHFIEKPGVYGHTMRVTRLYDKRVTGFKDSTVHDSVEWKADGAVGAIGQLGGALNHRCFRSYAHMIEKMNFYSTMQAEDMFRRNRRPSVARLIIEPFFAFFKAWIVRGEIRYGMTGYLESLLYAFARTLRLAKARAMYLQAERGKR